MSSSVAEIGGASTGAGDWTCSDSDCRHVNFARRTKCNRCQRERSVERNSSGASSKKKLGTEIGKAAAEKSRGLFSAEDWQCSKCANVNWARRQTCNMCNAPKFCDVEERTGYGGGYNDRGVVEYKERSESDSEYDEFGRLKKRKRKLETPAKSNNSRKPRRASNDDVARHDDDVDAEDNKKSASTVKKSDSKIKTKNDDSVAVKTTTEAPDDEDEEEDEEDDDSGDLSKYDLWGDEDIVSNVKDKNANKAKKSRSRSASTSSTSSSTSSSSSSSTASSSDTATSRSRSRSRSSASHSSSATSRRHKAPRARSPAARYRKHSRSRSPSGSGRRR